MVTIRDIAKKAGVSVGTVSHVINNKDVVGKEKKEKINKIIKELGYKPSRIAVSLSKKKTKNIAIVIPDINNPFYPALVKGAISFFSQRGYYVFLSNTDNDSVFEEKLISDFGSMWIDGIIVGPSNDKYGNLDIFKNIDLSMVLINSGIKNVERDLVVVDNFEASYEASNYLIGLNHKKIVALAFGKYDSSTNFRFFGYKKAMEDANLFDEDYVFWGEPTIEGGIELIEKAFRKLKKIDAIFAFNDLLAIGAMEIIKKKGLRIPKDISVIGFDNIIFSKYTDPPLSTISQPVYDIGEKAAELLFNRITGLSKNSKPIKVVLKSKLIKRGSVKKKYKPRMH